MPRRYYSQTSPPSSPDLGPTFVDDYMRTPTPEECAASLGPGPTGRGAIAPLPKGYAGPSSRLLVRDVKVMITLAEEGPGKHNPFLVLWGILHALPGSPGPDLYAQLTSWQALQPDLRAAAGRRHLPGMFSIVWDTCVAPVMHGRGGDA